MKRENKILELVPVEKQLDSEVKKAMLTYIDELKQNIENDEVTELICLTKLNENIIIAPITYSLSSAVGMLEIGKSELIISNYIDYME